MGTSSEALRGPGAVRLPAWVVIGVALALTGALAVATSSERDVVTRVPSGSAVTGEAVAPTDAAEMAGLKSAVALQYRERQLGISASSSREGLQVAEWKRALAAEFQAEQRGETTVPTFSYSDNTRPVQIDGELCGQCR